jgi:hypothetical protein
MRFAQRSIAIAATLASSAIAFAIGLWLGWFEWFGGYQARQRAFALGAIVIALAGSVQWLQGQHDKWPKFAGALIASLLAFEIGLDLGQALYVGPNSASDLVELFVAAWKRQL